jgi:hypothetical protein
MTTKDDTWHIGIGVESDEVLCGKYHAMGIVGVESIKYVNQCNQKICPKCWKILTEAAESLRKVSVDTGHEDKGMIAGGDV